MSVRWEFAAATSLGQGLWDHKLVEQETGERIGAERVALVLSYDEAFVIVGTPEELRALGARIASAAGDEPETIEDEDEEEA